MSDLIEEPKIDSVESEPTSFYELYAQRKFGTPPDWRVFRWDASKRDVIIITGVVVTARKERGKYKGQINWSKADKATEFPITIRISDWEAFLAGWERETGNCMECRGTGKTIASMSATEGIKYRDCRRCAATGRSPQTPIHFGAAHQRPASPPEANKYERRIAALEAENAALRVTNPSKGIPK